MFFNSLKFAIRSLGKYKMYTLVNLLGLTLGITAALLIGLYVLDELSFDRYHPDAQQIYQLVAEREVPGQGIQRSASLPAPLASRLEADIPAIEDVFRIIQLGRADLSYANNSYYEGVLATDPEIFDFLRFSFIQGDAETALSDPNSVVLTQSTAVKYFGTEDPVGKLLTGSRGENRVSAVIEDPPPNTHLQFNALFPFPPYLQFFIPEWQTNWNISAFTHYIKVAEGTDIRQLEQQLSAWLRQTPLPDAQTYQVSLLALPDIHFQSADVQQQWHANPGNIYTVYTLEAVALLLLLIASINYTSLATARSANRAQEISLRKMVGARPGQLMLQFVAEALLLTLFAALLATSIAQMLLPVVNANVAKTLTLMTLSEPAALVSSIGAVVLLGIAAGAYPALVLSRQHISVGLTDKQESSASSKLLRKLLVVTQFSLSVVLVFCTLVVMQQLNYVQEKSLGFDNTNVIAVDINSQPVRENREAIRNEFLQNPNVLSVSNSSRLPGDWKPIPNRTANTPGADAEASQSVKVINIDEHFLETFTINLVDGRAPDGSAPAGSVLVNQTLVERLGLDSPIGQPLIISDGQNTTDEPLQATISGVVEDFHFESLHQQIQPLVLGYNTNAFLPHDYFSVKMSGANVGETINYLRAVMQRHDQVTPFEYNFLDAQMETFYNTDRITATLFSLAALMAIFIACMGLFGLSSFTTEQRTREIGIRKVLGATIASIVRLLSADFMKPVFIGILIALPLGYYFMSQWLQNFAYYINIGLGVFIVSALLAILVSLATVSVQSVRAAMRNPVESIAYE